MKKILLLLAITSCLQACAQDYKTENVILISLDGYRWQEMFQGIDSSLLYSDFTSEKESLQNRFWRETVEERAAALNPFFIAELNGKGILLGDRRKSSKVNCVNSLWFSYPGYNEILTGRADDENITSNSKTPNPNTTFLEALNQEKDFRGEVAAFASWDVFPFIINRERSGVYVNAGFETARMNDPTEKEAMLNELQPQTTSPWGGVRLDVFTHNYALEYLKSRKPRACYIAYGETDDWAHNGNYTKYIEAAHLTNQFLSEIWNFIQSDEFYKDKTTLIITTDHGRGDNPKKNWTGHGNSISDAGEIWIAMIGPDINPNAKISGQFYQQQIAGTLMKLLNKPWTEGGKPLEDFLK